MLDVRPAAAIALLVTLCGCEGHPPKGGPAPTATTTATTTAATTATAVPLGQTKDVKVKGVTLKAPVDFTPWRDKELERLGAGMRKFRPDATEVEAQALRSQAGGMTAVRIEYPLFVAKGTSTSLRGRLQEELVNAEKGLMGAAPVESQDRKTVERDGGLELCVDGTSSRHVGAKVLSCLHLSVDARRRATLLYTMCSEKEGGRCRSIIASRAYTLDKPLPLDEAWPLERRPGLEDFKKDSIGWVRFGMKRPEFEKACKEAGGTTNVFAGMDATQRKILLKRGHVAQCSSMVLKTSLGDVVEIDANFESGVLGLAVLDTKRPRTEVIAIANQSLVGLRKEGDISVYALAPEPGEDDLAELAVWPAVSGGDGASIQVFSPKALKAKEAPKP